jgi:hypothetical protein
LYPGVRGGVFETADGDISFRGFKDGANTTGVLPLPILGPLVPKLERFGA